MTAPCLWVANDCTADESDPSLAGGLAHSPMTPTGGRFRLVILADFGSRRPDIERNLGQHRKLRPLGVRLLQRVAQAVNGIAVGEHHPNQTDLQLHANPL